MLNFASDYVEGCHEEILKAFMATNTEATESYGADRFSLSAAEKIKKEIGLKNIDVSFLAGGTQTNKIVLATLLRDTEGAIAADSGHIAIHEAGAIELSGHKVITVKGENGKLKAESVKEYMDAFLADGTFRHMAMPKAVYISHPTEYGTLYTKKELEALYKTCKQYGLYLYLDGARMGYGLMSPESDLTLKDIAKNTDVFYIGGTKVGALIGEAVVFSNFRRPENFLTIVKANGALLAKGRTVGIQFDTLFTNKLYFNISKNAIDRAMELKEMLINKGYKLFIDSPTNQQFFIINNKKLEELKKNVAISIWEPYDSENTVVRFCTSFMTTKEKVLELEKLI